ncbi:MAG TPA: hypothetical protein PLQ76_03900 [bacterium]|nr:hypothetical protein [bacterium]
MKRISTIIILLLIAAGAYFGYNKYNSINKAKNMQAAFAPVFPAYFKAFTNNCYRKQIPKGKMISGKIVPVYTKVNHINTANRVTFDEIDALVLKYLPPESVAGTPEEAETILIRESDPLPLKDYTYGLTCFEDRFYFYYLNAKTGACSMDEMTGAHGTCPNSIPTNEAMDRKNFGVLILDSEVQAYINSR